MLWFCFGCSVWHFGWVLGGLEFNWLCFVWVFNSVGICFHFSLLYVFWFVLALVFEFVVLGELWLL